MAVDLFSTWRDRAAGCKRLTATGVAATKVAAMRLTGVAAPTRLTGVTGLAMALAATREGGGGPGLGLRVDRVKFRKLDLSFCNLQFAAS